MQIGNYTLGQSITEHPHAKEFSWLDYLFERRKAPGERLYNIPKVEFLRAHWRLVISTIQNRIYKLSARYGTDTEAPMTAMLFDCIDLCRQEFGAHITSSKQDAAIWETPFGTVTVNSKGFSTGYSGRGHWVIILELTANLSVGHPTQQ